MVTSFFIVKLKTTGDQWFNNLIIEQLLLFQQVK